MFQEQKRKNTNVRERYSPDRSHEERSAADRPPRKTDGRDESKEAATGEATASPGTRPRDVRR